MDLKKKIRIFFTLNCKDDTGFTLVELIVVIAILAILAGVAIPVYNGYISKANQAADDTLIAAINQAAAMAVLEGKGEDMITLANGALSTNAIRDKPGITIWETYNQSSPVKEAFARYFEGNEGAALKWYSSLKFENGAFRGIESVLNEGLVVPEGSTVDVSFKKSSYATLGVAGMTGMLDTLAGALADYSNLDPVTDTEAFGKTLDDLGINRENADEMTLANAAVFYLADYTSQLNEADIWTHMKDGDLQSWLVNDTNLRLSNNDAIFLDTAIRYAAATAYAYSDIASDDVREIMANAKPTNRGDALTIISQVTSADSIAWESYIHDDDTSANNGMNDFHAFYEVMGVVNANNGNFYSVEGENLFSNAELQSAINSILGIEP